MDGWIDRRPGSHGLPAPSWPGLGGLWLRLPVAHSSPRVREALSAAVPNSAASVTAREHQESSGGCRVISLSLEVREEGVQHVMGAGRDRSCPPPPSATPCRLQAESLGVSKIMLFVQDLPPAQLQRWGLRPSSSKEKMRSLGEGRREERHGGEGGSGGGVTTAEP